MVPLVSFLAALRILTEAQSCNNGLGRLVYEKVSDYKMSTVFANNKATNETISRSGLPIKVLEDCIRRCQEDKTTAIETCLSFDFEPGKRRSSPYQRSQNGMPQPGIAADYEDSQCTLYSDRSQPDGSDMLVRHQNAWHFNEVCLSSNKLGTECPNRLYVFERIPHYRFEGLTDKEVPAANRTECEDSCLSATDMPCRSATFAGGKCHLSRETRYMNPRGFKSETGAEYMENMCLKRHQMCTSTAFILETNKELDGAYERELVAAQDFQECSNYCLNSLEERGFLCRSFIFDDAGHTCILYDEDPLFYGEIGQDPRTANQANLRRPLKSSAGNLYRILCVNTERVPLESDRSLQSAGPFAPTLHYNHGYNSPPPSWHRDQGMRSGYPMDRPPPPYPGPSGQHGGRFEHGYGNQPGQDYGSRPGPSFSYPPPSPMPLDHNLPPPSIAGGGLQISGSHPPPAHPHSIHHLPPGPQIHGPPFLPQGPPGPAYGIPYHNGPSPSAFPPPLPPLSGHPNAIPGSGFAPQAPPGFPGAPPPFPGGPPPPGFPGAPDRCQFPMGAPGAGGPVGFKRIGFGYRLRNMYIFKVIRADRQEDCERACIESRDFICRAFNYRSFFPAENCELSQYDSKQLKLENPQHYEQHTQFDFYERDNFAGGPPGIGGPPGAGGTYPAECLEVSQTCTPDGMEFTVKTPEGFYGRIYTYGYYDSCFYDGNGGSVNVLRISRANGFPRCGTQQYGDAMTNIVVVQFNDFVQTSRDKKYNLTCYFSGPGEAVVTSNYLDAKTDARFPTAIEHLPAQNILTSNVVLRVLYRGTPTNTIVVGDLLTFRLEARGHYRYDYYNSDIFATNVIAKDPYTGRQVHLIDARGCPVDLYVFPELHKTPDGALEAEFYAFKIPDSTFLVFQATVRTCRGPCEPVICTDRSRGHGSYPSWGRRKRQAIEDDGALEDDEYAEESAMDSSYVTPATEATNSTDGEESNPQEEVHELFRVYLSRADIPSAAEADAQVQVNSEPQVQLEQTNVCITHSGYYALITTITLLASLLLAIGVVFIYTFKRSRFNGTGTLFQVKETKANASNPNYYSASPLTASASSCSRVEHEPSEPIYTDPSVFERSRSLRSVTVSTVGSKPS
ncbi:hypothetical protein HDE_08746 [Halotydeus destructor]|nr:hypothetical protein HDE_08746 [Halotydeus destructor]